MRQWQQALSGVALCLVGGGLLTASTAHLRARIGPEPTMDAMAEPTPPRASGAEELSKVEKVASYELTAKLDPKKHTVDGAGTLRWVNSSSEPVEEIYVHLYLNAFKNERTVFLRRPAMGFRGSQFDEYGYIDVQSFFSKTHNVELWPEVVHSPDDEEDGTDIRVPLPEPVEPGGSLEIQMKFLSKLPSVVIRTGFHEDFHMVAQWFPKIARLEPDGRWAHFPFQRFSEFYADFGDYDVKIEVPKDFAVGATGKLQSSTTQEGRRVDHYRQSAVHDFAFVAWNRFLEASRTTDAGVEIRCLYPEGYEEAARVQLDVAEWGLAHLGKRYGAYPYETLTLMHPPDGAGEAGGMEYPTLITTGGSWAAPALGMRSVEGVTIHELGHQWFYGLMASNENRFPFLDEGINSFAEAEALDAQYGPGSALDFAGFLVSDTAIQRAFSVDVVHHAPVAQAADDFATGSDYGRLVYFRTATILHTLHRLHGDALLSALARFARDNRFGRPTPRDLIRSVEQEISPEAARYLQTALFEKGWVDYVVQGADSREVKEWEGIFGEPDKADGNPKPKKPYQGTVVVRREGTLVAPVQIRLRSEDGEETLVEWDGEASQLTIPYEGASALTAVAIDPDMTVLLDADLLNNHWRRSSGPVATKVWERLSFYVGGSIAWGAP